MCIKKGIDLYIFRLAEVHGNLQRASINIQNLIRNKYLFEIPSSPAWIVTIKFLKNAAQMQFIQKHSFLCKLFKITFYKK